MVAHLLWEQGAAGSNPVAPILGKEVESQDQIEKSTLKLVPPPALIKPKLGQETSKVGQSETKVGHFKSGQFLTVVEAASRLNVTAKTVQRWCQSGKLAAIPNAYGQKTAWLISPIALEAISAKVKQQEIEKSAHKGRPHGEYIRPWIKSLESGTLNGRVFSDRTIDDYRGYVLRFFQRFGQLTSQTLQIELQRIPSDQFAKREHCYKALLCYAKFLIQSGVMNKEFLSQVNTLKPIRHKPPKRHTINESNMLALLQSAQEAMDHALLLLLSSTGLRASECCQLLVSDVDFNEGWLRVRLAKGGKTRRVGLPDRVLLALKAWLDVHPDSLKSNAYLFINKVSKPLDRRGLHWRLERLGKLAGVKVSPHALRRAFVTINAGKGRPLVYLQKACGHSDIKTTMGYCLTTEAETVEAMKGW